MPMILTARLVVPIDRPPIVEGAVRVVGPQIAEVGRRRDLAGGPITDLGDVVLMPGLINAHAHLGLSAYAGRIKPSNLWMWLGRLMKLRRKTDPADERAAAVRAAGESLCAGVTCVADVSHGGHTLAVLCDVPIRKVCFAELISVARKPPRNPDELARLLDETTCDDRLAVGVSPHAPYTVSADHLAASVELARRRGLPITTHWAETREECRWLMRGGGLLGALIYGFDGSGTITSPRCAPMEYAERLGLLSAGALLAHVNYIEDDDLGRLSRSGASVVFCPRSHRFFGHRGHRWREMLAAGINVCVGTDSAASLPAGDGLSVLKDLRLLSRDCPDVPPDTLLSMVTIHSARALGLADRLGTLTPGKQADLVALPINPSERQDPLRGIVATAPLPTSVWIAGRRCVPAAGA